MAVVILTVPKETAFFLSSGVPTPPLMAPLLSAHFFAALLLFAAALGAIRAYRGVGAPSLSAAVSPSA